MTYDLIRKGQTIVLAFILLEKKQINEFDVHACDMCDVRLHPFLYDNDIFHSWILLFNRV